MRLILTCVIAVLASTLVFAADPAELQTVPESSELTAEPVVPELPVEPERAIDAADLSAYVDGLIDAAMQSDHIAGVTVAIVDRHGPLLLRGYGVAGQSPRRDVDPKSTMFRIGSISKTFTYLLALQLVDAGSLDPDAPANQYLPQDLQLPDDGFAPVLVRHLFTHNAGYEDSAMGHLFIENADQVPSLEDYVRQHRPARVREPGMHAVYSNYSLALLGVIVTQLSGKSFEELVDSQLLRPTGMEHTTFREPLAAGDPRNAGANFAGLWSDGFKRSEGGFATQKFEHIAHIAPVGSASSTAEDMGRYMRMLLSDGQIDGREVLTQAELSHVFTDAPFRNAPEVGGFSWGFFVTRVGGADLYGHCGATLWFHSCMQLVPELDLGIFISTNTETGRRFASEFPALVLEHYFAQARSADLPVAPESFDANRFTGSYNSERSNYSSIEKLFLSSTMAVTEGPDRSLVISGEGNSTRYVPDGALSFRELEGPGAISFLADDKGNIQGFAAGKGHVVYDRVRPWEIANNLVIVLNGVGVIGLFVLTGAWLRRNRRIGDQANARFSAGWLVFTALLWIAVTVAALLTVRVDETEMFYNFPGFRLRLTVWMALAAGLASLACLLLLRPAWNARGWSSWRKLRHTLAVTAFIVATIMLWIWNLLPWKM